MSTTTPSKSEVNIEGDKLRRKLRDEALAQFHISLFRKTRDFQNARSGLLSNESALKLATWDAYMSAINTAINAMHEMWLFGADERDEGLTRMRDYARAISRDDALLDQKASETIELILEKFNLSSAESERSKEEGKDDQEVAQEEEEEMEESGEEQEEQQQEKTGVVIAEERETCYAP